MENVVTLEDALSRITELEKENAKLREELDYYKNRKLSALIAESFLTRKFSN